MWTPVYLSPMSGSRHGSHSLPRDLGRHIFGVLVAEVDTERFPPLLQVLDSEEGVIVERRDRVLDEELELGECHGAIIAAGVDDWNRPASAQPCRCSAWRTAGARRLW